MKIKSLKVKDTSRNAEKDVVVTFDQKVCNFRVISDLDKFRSEIKAGISQQLPRFEDQSGDDDWTMFERVDGHEMLDEWSLSISESEIETDPDYDGEDAYEVKFVLDVDETYSA